MAMNSHLNDRELAVILTDFDRPQHPHLDECEACRQELQALSLFRRLAAAAEMPEQFFHRQRAAIWSGIAARPAAIFEPLPGFAWAAAAGLIALAVLLFSSAPAPAPAPARSQADLDHELLVAVEHAVSSDVPASLEPASLLAREIVRGSQVNPNSSLPAKETPDEN